jgi:hypothetical protein
MVVIDFTCVANIGQAFADEIFRVYPTVHPGTEIVANSANTEVAAMIQRAKAISTT